MKTNKKALDISQAIERVAGVAERKSYTEKREDCKVVFESNFDPDSSLFPQGSEKAYLVIGDRAVFLAQTDFTHLNYENYSKIVMTVEALLVPPAPDMSEEFKEVSGLKHAVGILNNLVLSTDSPSLKSTVAHIVKHTARLEEILLRKRG
jgi:uncharacterized protein YjaZ